MANFAQGQRWVVDSEPELGLGMVVDFNERAVTLLFPEADTERHYNARQAPLTRIQFEPGDEIHPREQSPTTVAKVHELNGLLVYETPEGERVVETQLAGNIRLNQPYMRLLTGQLDKPQWFSFRRQLDKGVADAWASGLKGLLGARAALIPHQLYVARQASDREQVRVLLADEVGLGKTLEAGLIISRLLTYQRIERVLVAVPDALQVQWLVELIRKFSIEPTLYDSEAPDFEHSGVHIVPHSVLAFEQEKLAEAQFDMLVVDEAHHLTVGSPEFDALTLLSGAIEHLLLLTATPEQLGVESHFQRLHLLDPAKFSSIDRFIEQEKFYAKLGDQLRQLPESGDALRGQFQLPAGMSDSELTDALLDRHGTGRVMFRNVRKAVAGFPERRCVMHRLEEDSWSAKFDWLGRMLLDNPSQKTLVICHSADHVRECEQYLWQKFGLDVACFFEDQTLIERDRAAAYFADEEGGTQALIASEIGSEGRNFQFASDLVCLDLPDHPELLEQRIGRLDRIGQRNTVHIHVPCAEGSDTDAFYRWYHGVLNCIEQQNPAAAVVHEKYWQDGFPDVDTREVAKEVAELQRAIDEGRDALLELNSCRQPQADELAAAIAGLESHTPQAIVEQASDLLQFHFEPLRDRVFSLIPADKMLVPMLPGIPPEGAEVTFDRTLANSREDVLFISWDSPLVEGLWDLMQESELGTASVATLPSKQLPAGHCLLEVCFDFSILSPVARQCRPFVSRSSVRSVVLDIGEADLAGALPEATLEKSIQPIKKHLAREVVKSRKTELPVWHKKAEELALAQQAEIQQETVSRIAAFYDREINRLQALQQDNPLVDASEVDQLRVRKEALLEAVNQSAQLQLSAVRLIVITPPGT